MDTHTPKQINWPPLLVALNVIAVVALVGVIGLAAGNKEFLAQVVDNTPTPAQQLSSTELASSPDVKFPIEPPLPVASLQRSQLCTFDVACIEPLDGPVDVSPIQIP